MNIEAGRQLLHYRIVDKLGEGGMGAVWRAVDTTLDREVAIKVLPADVAADAERLQRFEREAKALAAVQHPNIAAVYGLHDHEGLRFIAMELVEGVDLSRRLQSGPLAVDQALDVARQIARALDAAHERGVIHRDLKPANVVLAPDGQVKVLDFGLAKVIAPHSASGGTDPSLSPTVTSAGTVAGLILGTAAYMSPEQAKGHLADRRADIWGWGTILFEMLTGRRAFGGSTVSESLASVLKDEPDWTRLPAGLPAHVRRSLQRCLAKDPTRRLRDIGDALLELDAEVEDPEPQRAPSARLPWVLAACAAALALILTVVLVSGSEGEAGSAPLHAAIPAPPGVQLDLLGDYAGPPQLSPDGRKICFAGFGSERRSLYLHSLDDGSVRELPGTQAANLPFWSPDGTQLAYFAEGQLRRMRLDGSESALIAEAESGRGGAWFPDGTIVFSPEFRADLYRVPASGGTPELLVARDPEVHTTYRWPFAMPDGKHVLYLAAHHTRDAGAFDPSFSGQAAQIRFASLDGTVDRSVVTADSNPLFAAGHLIYLRGRKEIVAQPFDPRRGETIGPPRVVAQAGYDATTWRAPYTVSADGRMLVFMRGGAFAGSELRLYDRSGAVVETFAGSQEFGDIRLSPDGKRLATRLGWDIWIFDLERKSRMRFTFDDPDNSAPVWSSDGKIVFYDEYNRPDGHDRIHRRSASGAGEAELLIDSAPPIDVSPVDVTADGRLLLYLRGVRPFLTESDLWALPLDGGEPYPVIETPGTVYDANLSPDNRWLAYNSEESGRREIYVVPFDSRTGRAGSGRWQVSDNIGFLPAWRADGKELFFSGPDLMVRVVSVEDGPGGQPLFSAPRDLFRGYMLYGTNSWDVLPDGQSFLINTFGESRGEPMLMIADWVRALEEP